MKIHSDWHIHTHNSDGQLTMRELAAQAEQMGITRFGVSDHMNRMENLGNLARSREAYLAVLSENPALRGRFFFGVELTVFLSPAGHFAVAADRAFLDEMGVDYVVAGAHGPLCKSRGKADMIGDDHRQNMFLATLPGVDILAHYLWHGTRRSPENPFADFTDIPRSMKLELAHALRENNCAFELNIEAILLHPALSQQFKHGYLEYAAQLQSMGVSLSIGSDCHFRLADVDYEGAARMIAAAGIDPGKNMFERK
ncbi:MAG: PHP domain-containing protein [Oscillospiraceae bacterium]|nr:PHP domain-containing protein [Oscillospiraceae bacterium]